MMLCTYCNASRLANEEPCPQCGAPSPLIGGAMNNYGTVPPSADVSRTTVGLQWNGWTSTGPLQGSANDNSLWAQVMAPNNVTATQPPPQMQQPSLLPVPYQAGIGVAQPPLVVMSPDPSTGETLLVPVAYDAASLVPALPDTTETIHVPPMYTKPRAIIPRYRIISGLLSLFIVAILLCSGAGYYAKVSGKLAFLNVLWRDARLQNLAPTSAHSIPDPPLTPAYGPAKNIINSASTASSVDPKTAIALQPSNVFAPGQIIYLTYSVHPKGGGVVVFKWYTDKVLYKTITSPPITEAKEGYYTMRFTQPVEGEVELYWNDELAIRLFFVVR